VKPDILRVMRLVRDVVCVAAMLVLAVNARAQTSVGGTVGVSTQAEGDNDLPALGLPFGGTSVSAIATIDRAWTRHFALGGEVSTATAISGDQSQRTGSSSNAFVSRHRDTVFSAMVKFGVPIGRLRAAAAGGAGTAYRRTSREGTTASLLPPASRAPFTETVSNFVFEYTVGADVTCRVTDRIDILFVGRVHKLHDDDRLDTGVVRRGVSSTVYRAGAGALWRF
jgi:hypothetical protein